MLTVTTRMPNMSMILNNLDMTETAIAAVVAIKPVEVVIGVMPTPGQRPI